MKRFMKKAALLLAAVMVATSVPVPAKAATTPAFVKTHDIVYENSTTDGVYKYTVSGLQKGYKVKWVVKGAGKDYVTLKFSEKAVSNSTSSNKITVDTNGNTAAVNKKFKVVAKIYDANGKKIKTLKDKPVIKVCAETVNISTAKLSSLDNLEIGKTYDFDASMTPVNTSSQVYWSVTNDAGIDCSTTIDSNGVWTPTAVGEYTIKAEAKNTQEGQVLCTSSVNVTVGTYLKAVTQTGADELKVVFSSDVTDKLNKNNLVIKTKNGTSAVIPGTFVYDTVGKTVTITTQQTFKDKVEYEVTYSNSTKAFTASVGTPVYAKILTETVPAETATVMEYGLFDENNIDVTAVCEGEIIMESKVTNGYLTQNSDKEYELIMKDLGSTTVVNLTYKPIDGSANLTASQTVTCVKAEAEEATRTNFTITLSKDEPEYDSSTYEEVRSISLDEKGYAHFRALDEDGDELDYDSIVYSSSDNNALIISADGEITPIKTGTVNVFVTVTVAGEELPYIFAVTVEEAKELTSIALTTDSVTMSKTYQNGYQETVGITAYDQFGEEMSLTNASVVITETSNKTVYATYDAASQKIIVKNTYVAGSYTYKVAVTIDGETATDYLYLEVKEVPSTGTVTYAVQLSEETVDVAIDTNTTYNKTATVRVAKYKGGLFDSYVTFNSVTIMKDGKYYSSDLTAAGSTTAVTMGGSTVLTLTAMQLIQGSAEVGECRKAEAGTYTISMKYLDSNSNAYQYISTVIKVTDSQGTPVAAIGNTTADAVATNALELVKDCISVSSGEIYDCTAVGETETGSNIAITSGKQLHIKTISVREEVATGNAVIPKVYIYHTITIGQTLTNK